MDTAAREQNFFNRVLVGFDAPAFIKRARRVAAVHDTLRHQIRLRRDNLLVEVRTTLETLLALGDTEAGVVHLAESVNVARVPSQPAAEWRIRWARGDLHAAMERFNLAWAEYLLTVDVSEVNAERDGYNRFYVLEKDCVVRNSTIAASGFEPLPPLTLADLHAEFPPLPGLM